MTTMLVDDDLKIWLSLSMDADSREAIGIQIQRSVANWSTHSIDMRPVNRHIDVVDPDLRKPTLAGG
jgi:hypothetical protein